MGFVGLGEHLSAALVSEAILPELFVKFFFGESAQSVG
jgi:hypothetical protein